MKASDRLFRLFCLLIIFSLLASCLPQHGVETRPAVQAGPVEAKMNPASAPTGRLLYPDELTADGDPATNPDARAAVPVSTITRADKPDSLAYTILSLAVEARPEDAKHNPAGAQVSFHLWNDSRSVDLTRQAKADAWGAAFTQVFLDDQHLEGPFYYSASAPGYLPAETQQFLVDRLHPAGEMRLAGAHLQSSVEADGRLVMDIHSDLEIDDQTGAAQVTAVRLEIDPQHPGQPQAGVTIPLVAERISAHAAHAEVYLEPGDYLLLANASNGKGGETQSQPALVHVNAYPLPAVQQVEWSQAAEDSSGQSLVQYRTPSGAPAVLLRPASQMPTGANRMASTPGEPGDALAAHLGTFEDTVRTGAFRWSTDTYSLTMQTLSNDGHKTASLAGFHYDPIASTFDLRVDHSLTQTVEDTLSVEVLGPHGVVIYQEQASVTLQPGEPLYYQLHLPSDKGQPYGLRLTLKDPLGLEFLWEKISSQVQTTFQALAATVSGMQFTLTAEFPLEIRLVGITLFNWGVYCDLGTGCRFSAATGLLANSSNWLDRIWTEVKVWVSTNFHRDVWELAANGIELGFIQYSAYIGPEGQKVLYDPVKCPDPKVEAIAKATANRVGWKLTELTRSINVKLANINERIFHFKQYAMSWPIPVPPPPSPPILAVKVAPVLSFDLNGGKRGAYTIYLKAGVRLGAKVGVWLNLINLGMLLTIPGQISDFINIVYYTFETVHQLGTLSDLMRQTEKYAGISKKCDPDPPDGHPDERLDPQPASPAAQPTQGQAMVAEAAQKIQTAQRLGLALAEVYWTYQLRQRELGVFDADTTHVYSDTLGMDNLASLAQVRISGLISGTILPEPGQTITETLMATYLDFTQQVNASPHDQSRQQLLDALSFAQRQYDGLRGQELELQRQLVLLSSHQGLGVLDAGLSAWTAAALQALGIPFTLVSPLNSSPAYASPYHAPAGLIIPTGGLNRYQGVHEVQAWLEAYVSNGGTLIVLSQAQAADWELLPGGQVRGLGYEEDILCQTASVQVTNPSVWLTGIGHDLPDIQVDGSLTAWPANAVVTLLRTSGTRMGAMLYYPFGAGQVVVTSAYPDFYINGMQSRDDIIFARSLFGEAYLQATGQAPILQADPGQAISISLPITNTSSYTLTQVTAYADYYGTGVGESWRWGVHPLGPYWMPPTPLTPVLGSGQGRSVTFDLIAPDLPGLFHTGYLTSAGVGMGGPFYLVRTGFIPLGFKLDTDQYEYGFGQEAVLTARVTNTSLQARSLTLEALEGSSAAPLSFNLAPGQVFTHTYNLPVLQAQTIRMGLRENGSLVSQQVASLRLRPPSLGLEWTPEQASSQMTLTLQATASLMNSQAALITWQLRHNGVLQASATSPLVPTGEIQQAHWSVPMPPASDGSAYTLRAALPDGSAVLTATIPVRAPAILSAAAVTTPLHIGQSNPGALSVVLASMTSSGQVSLHTRVTSSAGELSSGPVLTVTLDSPIRLVHLDTPLPAGLDLNTTYTITVLGQGHLPSGPAFDMQTSLPLQLTAPRAVLADSQMNAGESLAVQLSFDPSSAVLPSDGPYTLTLQRQSGGFLQSYRLPYASAQGNGLLVQMAVPGIQQGGRYDLWVATPRLANWNPQLTWDVPEGLRFSAANTASSPGSLPWAAHSLAAFTQTLTGTLALVYANNTTVVTQSVQISILPFGSSQVSLGIPEQLAAGYYSLAWSGIDQAGRPSGWNATIHLSGLLAGLASRTEQPVYLSNQPVTATTWITPNLPLVDAHLRLQVLKPGGSWSGWMDPQGNGGATRAISETAYGPFSPAWAKSLENSIPPVSVGDKVYYTDNGNVVAARASDGRTIWSQPISYTPLHLVANSHYVMVSDQFGVYEFDAVHGDFLQNYFYPYSYIDDLIASENWIAIRSTYDFYTVADPGGVKAGIRVFNAAYTGALLVGDSFYYKMDAEGGGGGYSLRSMDILSDTIRWTSPLTGTLLAADQDYVLSLDRPANQLYVYQAGDGGLAHILALEPLDANFPYALSGQTLIYCYHHYTGGKQCTSLDLASGTEGLALVTLPGHNILSVVQTGSYLHLLTDQNQVISIDLATGDSSSYDLATPVTGGAEYSLGVYTGGLWVLDTSALGLQVLKTPHNPAGLGQGSGFVTLSTAWVEVAGSGPQAIKTLMDGLGSNPLARGLLYLDATLFGREPQSEAQYGDHQQLAGSLSSFSILDVSSAVSLAADQPAYRYNQPGYALDDADSSVQLSGLVSNTSALPASITLTVTRGSGIVFQAVFPSVPAGIGRAFAFTDPNPPVGTSVYTATTSLGGQDSYSVEIIQAQPTVQAYTSSYVMILGQSEQIIVQMHNRASLRSFLTADLGDGPREARLEPGQTITLTRLVTPSAATYIQYPVVLTGDVQDTYYPASIVQDQSLTSYVELHGNTRDAHTVVQGAGAELWLRLNNPSPGFWALMHYTIQAGANTVLRGSDRPAIFTDPATDIVPIDTLPDGSYTAVFTVTNETTNQLLTVASLPFSVVSAQIALDLQAAGISGNPPTLAIYQFTARSLASSEGPWNGSLVLSGAANARWNLNLAPGASQVFTGTLDLAERAGDQILGAALVNLDGTLAIARTLTLQAPARLAPLARLGGLAASPAAAGGSANFQVTVDNPGPAGEADLSLEAFDQSGLRHLSLPAGSTQVITFSLPVPAFLLAGSYPALARLESQELAGSVVVSGGRLELAETLDRQWVDPFESFTWTAWLTATAGGAQVYDLSMRYNGHEYTQTLTLAAGQHARLDHGFSAGTTSGRATLLVTNHPLPGQPRHTLLIDSLPVQVRQNPGAWLESDRSRASAGDTVHLSLHLTAPARQVEVFAPPGLDSLDDLLLWSTLNITTTRFITGTFPIEYVVPLNAATARYDFTYVVDGEENSLPLDVYGMHLSVENMRVKGPASRGSLQPGDPLTITARLDLAFAAAQNRPDTGLGSAWVEAYALDPAGGYLDLGAGAAMTTTLPAGITLITLHGRLNTHLAGLHQVVLKVWEGASGWPVGSAAVNVDVGMAHLASLSTDHGLYVPGQAGAGMLTAYGQDPGAQVRVTTSGGQVLLARSLPLSGFATLTFTIPTQPVMDEALVGVLTDTLGMTSTLTSAYKVANSLDLTAPQMAVTSPQDNALVLFHNSVYTITVAGVVTETGSIAEVWLLHGADRFQASLSPDKRHWRAQVGLERGANMLQVFGRDQAGNLGVGPRLTVLGEPDWGVQLSVSPGRLQVGQVASFTAVVTATETLTGTLTFPFSLWGAHPKGGSASQGTLTLGSLVSWTGPVSPGHPVTIQWSGVVTTTGTLSLQVLYKGPAETWQASRTAALQVDPAGHHVYLPVVVVK